MMLPVDRLLGGNHQLATAMMAVAVGTLKRLIVDVVEMHYSNNESSRSFRIVLGLGRQPKKYSIRKKRQPEWSYSTNYIDRKTCSPWENCALCRRDRPCHTNHE